MPVIRIDYDGDKLKKEEAVALSEAAQKIVIKATGIEDVFVYANSAEIRVNVWPVEIFVQLSTKFVKDEDKLVADIKTQLSEWKKEYGFKHPINFTFIPMNWRIEIEI